MFDYLVNRVRKSIEQIPDHRPTTPTYSLADVLMSGFAMFSLKDPSLLSFIDKFPTRKENLEQVYKITSVPSQQGFDKILDPVNPDALVDTFI